MLAYIKLTNSISIDHYGSKYFQNYDSYVFINVQYIARCVGFVEINNRIYIIDKKGQVSNE